jgi:hypothetical protein
MLPRSLAVLVRRQALGLSVSRFETDVTRLLKVLDQTLAEAPTRPVIMTPPHTQTQPPAQRQCRGRGNRFANDSPRSRGATTTSPSPSTGSSPDTTSKTYYGASTPTSSRTTITHWPPKHPRRTYGRYHLGRHPHRDP